MTVSLHFDNNHILVIPIDDEEVAADLADGLSNPENVVLQFENEDSIHLIQMSRVLFIEVKK